MQSAEIRKQQGNLKLMLCLDYLQIIFVMLYFTLDVVLRLFTFIELYLYSYQKKY